MPPTTDKPAVRGKTGSRHPFTIGDYKIVLRGFNPCREVSQRTETGEEALDEDGDPVLVLVEAHNGVTATLLEEDGDPVSSISLDRLSDRSRALADQLRESVLADFMAELPTVSEIVQVQGPREKRILHRKARRGLRARHAEVDAQAEAERRAAQEERGRRREAAEAERKDRQRRQR